MGCEPPWPDFRTGTSRSRRRPRDGRSVQLSRPRDERARALGSQASRRSDRRCTLSAPSAADPRIRGTDSNAEHAEPDPPVAGVLRSCRLAFAGGPLQAVHLHGLLPCLVGGGAVRSAGSNYRSSFRPMGHDPWVVAHHWRAGSVSDSAAVPPAASRGHRNRAAGGVCLRKLGVRSPRREPGERGLSRGASQRSSATLDRHGRPGSAPTERRAVRTVCRAARRRGSAHQFQLDRKRRRGVTAAIDRSECRVFDVTSEQECASRLAAAWIYTAPVATRGFPPVSRQGHDCGLALRGCRLPPASGPHSTWRNGFPVSIRARHDRSASQTLLDNPTLRARIGDAAREEARRRFGEHRFSASLLTAYAENALRIDGAEVLEAHG